jgi:hypothetical protein
MARGSVLYIAICREIAFEARTGRQIAEALAVCRVHVDRALARMRDRIVHVEGYAPGRPPSALWRLGRAADGVVTTPRRSCRPAHERPILARFILAMELLMDDEPRSARELAEMSGAGHQVIRALLRSGHAGHFMRIAEWDREVHAQCWTAHWSMGHPPDAERPAPMSRYDIERRSRESAAARRTAFAFPTAVRRHRGVAA